MQASRERPRTARQVESIEDLAQLQSGPDGVHVAAVLDAPALEQLSISRQHDASLRASDTLDLFIAKMVVVQRVEPGHAQQVREATQVRVRDEVWRAVPVPGAGPFEPGALVTVQGVDGVTLQVR